VNVRGDVFSRFLVVFLNLSLCTVVDDPLAVIAGTDAESAIRIFNLTEMEEYRETHDTVYRPTPRVVEWCACCALLCAQSVVLVLYLVLTKFVCSSGTPVDFTHMKEAGVVAVAFADGSLRLLDAVAEPFPLTQAHSTRYVYLLLRFLRQFMCISFCGLLRCVVRSVCGQLCAYLARVLSPA